MFIIRLLYIRDAELKYNLQINGKLREKRYRESPVEVDGF